MKIVNHRLMNTALVALLSGTVLLIGAGANPAPAAGEGEEIELKAARIYWEFNATANDLGVHVLLDGDHWKKMRITKPNGQTLFDVKGSGPYAKLGLTELFFEGAEPSLDDVPLAELLALFPEGEYEFEGKTVDGLEIEGEADFSHAIPDAPRIRADVGPGNSLVISWTHVDSTPPGFPAAKIEIESYLVEAGSFKIEMPASATSVTVPAEYVAGLEPGEHDFEVLAVDASGNQTIAEGVFVK